MLSDLLPTKLESFQAISSDAPRRIELGFNDTLSEVLRATLLAAGGKVLPQMMRPFAFETIDGKVLLASAARNIADPIIPVPFERMTYIPSRSGIKDLGHMLLGIEINDLGEKALEVKLVPPGYYIDTVKGKLLPYPLPNDTLSIKTILKDRSNHSRNPENERKKTLELLRQELLNMGGTLFTHGITTAHLASKLYVYPKDDWVREELRFSKKSVDVTISVPQESFSYNSLDSKRPRSRFRNAR